MTSATYNDGVFHKTRADQMQLPGMKCSVAVSEVGYSQRVPMRKGLREGGAPEVPGLHNECHVAGGGREWATATHKGSSGQDRIIGAEFTLPSDVVQNE